MGQFKFNFSGITAIIVFQQVSAKFFYCFKLILFDDVFLLLLPLNYSGCVLITYCFAKATI